MLQYEAIKKYKHSRFLIRLWNSELKHSYPIQKALFKENVLDDSNLNKDASFVAFYENEPVGFIFIKTWFEDSGFASETQSAYISLIFVKKAMRNMGIGSDLLRLSLNEIKKHPNIKKLYVGNEINRIFPGVPNEFSYAPVFFMSKGFTQREGVVDMIYLARSNRQDEKQNRKGLKIRIATEEEKNDLLKLCVKNNWSKEAYLVNKYYENGGSGRRIVIGTLDNQIIAFSRINDENKLPIKTTSFINNKKLGCILFSRIDKDFVNKGYEEVIISASKEYLIKRGCKKIAVLGVKDIQFYKKLGYSAFKYYLNFELDL